jgi:membrane protease YdiL (CAAX protease family)
VERLRHLYARATAGPDYPPDAGDRADVQLLGLTFPVRASIAILAMTAIVVADELQLLVPVEPAGGYAFGLRAHNVERFVLFLLAPLAIVVVGFGDRPARYGLRLGDWRWGAGLLAAGLIVMTPIILGLASLPQFRDYYGTDAQPVETVLANHIVELVPAEFLLRGFLMFALWRRIGPLALVVSLVPFVFTHVGKPDIELWSTFLGGSVFAWLNWRTGSILWSAAGHVYVLTLMEVAVGGATL